MSVENYIYPMTSSKLHKIISYLLTWLRNAAKSNCRFRVWYRF